MKAAPLDRFSPCANGASDVERLCAYLKNDSLIRWHLGCSQAEIDEAREHIAKRRRFGAVYYPETRVEDFGTAEERQRAKRAEAGNRAYLQAIARAAG